MIGYFLHTDDMKICVQEIGRVHCLIGQISASPVWIIISLLFIAILTLFKITASCLCFDQI